MKHQIKYEMVNIILGKGDFHRGRYVQELILRSTPAQNIVSQTEKEKIK